MFTTAPNPPHRPPLCTDYPLHHKIFYWIWILFPPPPPPPHTHTHTKIIIILDVDTLSEFHTTSFPPTPLFWCPTPSPTHPSTIYHRIHMSTNSVISNLTCMNHNARLKSRWWQFGTGALVSFVAHGPLVFISAEIL